VRDGADLFYLEKVHNHEIDVPTRVGQREPLHCTAAGKVLLAYAPRAVIERYVTGPLARFTAHTLIEPRRLLGELDRIRETGIACDREEFCLGMASTAARVRNHTGKIVAAISVAGSAVPHDRWLKQVQRPLGATAAEIERRLGWGPVTATTQRQAVPA
jgi:DNA-binding IclR family transcriptional regulator